MFTGIVEGIGTVERVAVDPRRGGRLEVRLPFEGSLAVGESVAVDGCCLTALEDGGPRLVADLSPQTLALTTLASLRVGARVNVERAVHLGDRLGGHLVQGHVDGVEELQQSTAEGDGRRHRYSLAEERAGLLVPQGSVAVNGVSLTVAALGSSWFEVALVPHTLEVTALGGLEPGDRVNVEHDVAGKYVLRALGLSGHVEIAEGLRRRLGLD